MKYDNDLQNNFASVAMASVKHSAYAAIAEREGYRQVSRLFRAMAEAEKVHAVNTLKALGELADTSGNLTNAIDSKTFNYSQRYPSLIEQAELDENHVASATYQSALDTSKSHIRLLNEALNNLGRNKDFDYWVCSVCGFIVTGEMPVSCKICGAAREKFGRVELMDNCY